MESFEKKMKIAIIIEARMSSSRLPGKVLLKVKKTIAKVDDRKTSICKAKKLS